MACILPWLILYSFSSSCSNSQIIMLCRYVLTSLRTMLLIFLCLRMHLIPFFQYLSQVLLLLLNHASFPLSLLRYQVMESPINCNQISMPLTHNPTDPSLAHNPTNPSLAHNPTNSLFAPHDDSSLLMAVELRTQLVVSLALRLLHRRYLFRYQDSWISKIQSS